MKRKSWLICAATLWVLVVSVAAYSQNAPSAQNASGTQPAAKALEEKLPSVNEILDRYTAALGGKAAADKITSRVSKGTFELVGSLNGSITTYEKAPNLSSSTTELPGWGTVIRRFNGTAGWNDSPDGGMQEFTAAEVAAAKHNADFYREFRLADHFPKLTVTGRQRTNNHDSYVVKGEAAGNTDTMYFDVNTGLLFHVDSERPTPEGKTHVRMDVDDYRAVDGIKLPFMQRVSRPEYEYIIRLTEVKHNVPIDDAVFQKPVSK